MHESDKTFREELLGQEQWDAGLREKYDREVQAMIEKKIVGWTRFGHIVGLGMSLGFLALFGTAAVLVPREFPLWGRAMFATGAAFGFAFAVFEVCLLRRGTVNLKNDDVAMAGMGWGCVVIGTTLVLVFSGKMPDQIVAVKMLVSMIVFEVAAGFMLAKAYMQRSELNLREKLLEIEMRLEELTQRK